MSLPDIFVLRHGGTEWNREGRWQGALDSDLTNTWLIESLRTSANHRRYDRRELCRIAITRIAQSVGVPLAE